MRRMMMMTMMTISNWGMGREEEEKKWKEEKENEEWSDVTRGSRGSGKDIRKSFHLILKSLFCSLSSFILIIIISSFPTRGTITTHEKMAGRKKKNMMNFWEFFSCLIFSLKKAFTKNNNILREEEKYTSHNLWNVSKRWETMVMMKKDVKSVQEGGTFSLVLLQKREEESMKKLQEMRRIFIFRTKSKSVFSFCIDSLFSPSHPKKLLGSSSARIPAHHFFSPSFLLLANEKCAFRSLEKKGDCVRTDQIEQETNGEKEISHLIRRCSVTSWWMLNVEVETHATTWRRSRRQIWNHHKQLNLLMHKQFCIKSDDWVTMSLTRMESKHKKRFSSQFSFC